MKYFAIFIIFLVLVLFNWIAYEIAKDCKQEDGVIDLGYFMPALCVLTLDFFFIYSLLSE